MYLTLWTAVSRHACDLWEAAERVEEAKPEHILNIGSRSTDELCINHWNCMKSEHYFIPSLQRASLFWHFLFIHFVFLLLKSCYSVEINHQCRQKKLPSVEVRLKRLKSTEGFSTCCAIAQRLISTATPVDFNRGWFQPLQGLISTAAWINIVQ